MPKRAINCVATNRRKRGTPAATWKSGIRATVRDIAIDEGEWKDRKGL